MRNRSIVDEDFRVAGLYSLRDNSGLYHALLDRPEDGVAVFILPEMCLQAAARTPASEQKPAASKHQVLYEQVKVRSSLLPVLAGAQKVPRSLREWPCRFSRGSLQVVASACASRREDACKRAKVGCK